VNRTRTLKSASFRFMLLYAALFGVSVFVLCAQIYWSTTQFLKHQIREDVRLELAKLQGIGANGGFAQIAAAIGQRTVVSNGEWDNYYYLLVDRRGHVVAGNLLEARALTPGWHRLPSPRAVSDREDHVIRTETVSLPRGGRLSVGRDSFTAVETAEQLLRSFLGAAIVTGLLALSGGLLMSSGLLRRLDAVNRAAREIIAGNLRRRVALRGSDDEFDQLAVNLNAMLDRIEALMEGLHQVSSDIAHDLRTPLARLHQGLEATQRTAATPADYEPAIARALAEADTLLRTFSALLGIARIESGADTGTMADVDLSELGLTMLETYGPVAEDRGQTLGGRVADGLHIRGDRALLVQMLANLIENALKHGPAGTRVELVLERIDRRARLSVVDNGPGIPKAERNKVFQRFYRLDSSRSTPGNGLGLSLVAAVAARHDARVGLSDAGPGLRVSMEFPLVAPLPADVAPAPAPSVDRIPSAPPGARAMT
jgi:signal transduction histidine kinase